MAHRHKEIFARYNLKDGTSRVESIQALSWWYHPDDNIVGMTDVAIAPISFDWNIVDHECIPLYNFDITVGYPELAVLRDIGLGDETFTVGLFRNHYGAERNIPIIRIGNISAMPEEPIKTKHGAGFVEGYLVEMRSIAGLSGSPVFVDRPQITLVTQLQDMRLKRKTETKTMEWPRYHFLGLIHGHFDINGKDHDIAIDEDADSGDSVVLNTGIGIVIPAHRILETLYQSGLNDQRDGFREEIRRRGATPDLV